MIVFKNGRATSVPYKSARAMGGSLKPQLIVLHDTAGRLEKGSSVRWFQDLKCNVSAHFVVERDGTITQMVPTNRRAWHAGVSTWGGRQYCNSYAVGIEIVSPGKLDAAGKAWFGSAATPAEIQHQASAEHGGDGYWLPYTAAQVDAVKQLCKALIAAYPDCNEIVGHYQISPGRKIDPSPLLPLEDIRAYALGEGAESADAPDATTGEVAAVVAKKSVIPVGFLAGGGAAIATPPDLSGVIAWKGFGEQTVSLGSWASAHWWLVIPLSIVALVLYAARREA